jgi:hypothetical protein
MMLKILEIFKGRRCTKEASEDCKFSMFFLQVVFQISLQSEAFFTKVTRIWSDFEMDFVAVSLQGSRTGEDFFTLLAGPHLLNSDFMIPLFVFF